MMPRLNLDGLKLLSDEPCLHKPQFEFLEYAEQLAIFLENYHFSDPLSIALHAQWGMGKTTLLYHIKNHLEIKKTDKKIIVFNAWQYEGVDLFVSLLIKIEKEYPSKKKRFWQKSKSVFKLLIDASLRSRLNMSLDDAHKHFSGNIDEIAKLKETIKDLIGKDKFIIFIDDLDRCSVENILKMLESLKLFLNIPNIVIFTAMDLTKIETAWALRYPSKLGKMEGRSHAEKIFSLKLALPPITKPKMLAFVEYITELDEVYSKLILSSSGHNLRKIKRMVNLLYFLSITSTSMHKALSVNDSDTYDTYLQLTIHWIALTLNHPNIASLVIHQPSYLIRASAICHGVRYQDRLLELVKLIKNPLVRSNSWDVTKCTIHKSIISEKVLEILELINEDRSAFNVIQTFFSKFHHVHDENDLILLDGKEIKSLDKNCMSPLNEIIKNSGLIGI